MDYLLVLALVVVAAVAYVVLFRGKSVRQDGVLIVGPQDAGKSALFYSLALGAEAGGKVTTVTSMKQRVQNGAEVGGKACRLVDYPGHGRLRGQVAQHFPGAACIVFVVDASDTSVKAIQGAAEFLYDMFSHRAFVSRKPTLVVCCNKSDKDGAATPAKMKALLETEITQIKKTSAAIQDDGDGARVRVGADGERFSFDDQAPCASVTFEAVSVKEQLGVASVVELVGQSL